MAEQVSKNRVKDQSIKLFDRKLDPEAYNYIATASSLIAVQLIASNFDVSPDFFAKGDKVKIDLCHKILATDFYEKTQVVAGIFQYEVVAKVVRKHVMTARADFMVVYELPEGSAENETKAFCARVGLFAAYPYFRALFAHFASAGNIEIPALPVLSADPPKKQIGKQSTVPR